ncbi:hypothetical protein DL98DRAFT_434658, partial [Cadophora sp. DSE1049]
YTLKLPSLYGKLHLIFHISLLKEYVTQTNKELNSFLLNKLPELSKEDDL